MLMRRRLRAFAMFDTIVAPDMRSFEWHPRWGKRELMGAFKDGEGNFFFAWFSPHGAVVRGFDHESKMSPFQKDPPEIWPGMFDGLPKILDYAKKEPAFALEEITFCFWATTNETKNEADWTAGKIAPLKGKDVDGAGSLLACFGNFHTWASTYYGEPIDRAALDRLFREQEPIDWAMLEALNVDFDERAVREEAELLEWPIDLSKRDAHKKKAKAKGKTSGEKEKTDAVASSRRVPKTTNVERVESFGAAEFTVRCEPTRVVLRVRDKNVAVSRENVYDELFDLVRARLERR
jgi:hypothetical protein